MIRAIRNISFLALPFFGLACATTDPPRDLVDARTEYQAANSGVAAKMNPAGLYEAKKSLDQANKAFEQDATSDNTRDMSYIALRKVQLASAQARIEVAGQEKAASEREKARLEQKLTQSELAEVRRKLSEAEEQRRAEAEQLQSTSHQLETERQARLAAEKKAEEATANLAKIAMVKQEARGLVITLSGSVLFTSGRSTLLANARPKLDEVATALQKSDAEKFVVEGHTDSIGSDATNEELSYRRAQTVDDYLIERGVPAEKIRAVGYGKSRPVADNTTAEGRANNRRVEIIIQPKSAAAARPE